MLCLVVDDIIQPQILLLSVRNLSHGMTKYKMHAQMHPQSLKDDLGIKTNTQ